jgi:hypothetical protein
VALTFFVLVFEICVDHIQSHKLDVIKEQQDQHGYSLVSDRGT